MPERSERNGDKYEEAILSFQKVIKIDPKNIEARVGLAGVYVKTGNQDKAEKVLKEAIPIDPKRIEPYLELAKLYITQNNPVNAFKVLNEGYKATNSDKIKAMLEDLKSKITVTDINKTITLGQNYSLPNEITVKINNTEAQFPVKWDTSTVDTTKVGITIYTGTLENTDKIVKLTLNIIAIASIDDINNKIMQNDKYSLPTKVKAKMADNSIQDVEVTWTPSVVDTSKSGSYSYQGAVSGYNNKIKLTLDVLGIASIAKNSYKKYLGQPLEGIFEKFVLLDLDFDGVPEIFGGSISRTFSPVDLAITMKSGVVTRLSFDGDNGISGSNNEEKDNTDIGLPTFLEMKLYRNKETNKYIYIGKDSASRSYEVGQSAEYEIYLNNGKINVKEIFYDEFNNEYGNSDTLYRCMKKEVGKSEYDIKHNEYYNQLEEVTAKMYIGGMDLNSEQSINDFLNKGFAVLED